MLRYHDLVAVFPPDHGVGITHIAGNESVTCRAYETWPSNFDATCAALHATDWLDDGILPLVLSHLPLSPAEEAALPSYVAWTHLRGAPDDTLAVLRKLLVDTQEKRGFICIDFADHVFALAPGGEFDVFCGHGATALVATEGAVRQANVRERQLSHAASSLLCVRAGPDMPLSDLEAALAVIDRVVSVDCISAASSLPDQYAHSGAETLLMSVMPRRLK